MFSCHRIYATSKSLTAWEVVWQVKLELGYLYKIQITCKLVFYLTTKIILTWALSWILRLGFAWAPCILITKF